MRSALLFALLVGGCASTPPKGARSSQTFPAITPAPSIVEPRPDHALLDRCRTTKPSAASLRVVWRADRFASLFWSVDQWSRWDEQQTSDVYEAFFRKELGDDARDREMLASYRRLRLAYSRELDRAPPDAAHPVDMLVPETSSADELVRRFLCTGDARAAATLIGMTPVEVSEVARIFEHFSARLATLVTMPHVERARARMEAMAGRAEMSAFLDRMVEFYGTRARLPGELTVEILWGPPNTHQATTMADRMLVPISERMADDPKNLASEVGVTVHEFGHRVLGAVTPDERNRVSERIVARGGIVRQRHSNLVDEATQAALGNLHFLREHLPEGLDEQSVYSFETGVEYPDAIDSLARRAEPLVARALERREPFGGTYLDRLLDEQARLMPPRLSDFAHVGFLLTGSKIARQWFSGLFWGRSRFAYEIARGDAFADDSSKSNAASRWIVLTEPELPAILPIAERATVDGVRAVGAELARRHAKGCVRAARRPDVNGAPGGYDIVVLGRDSSGLRETLIAVQRGISPAAASPHCL